MSAPLIAVIAPALNMGPGQAPLGLAVTEPCFAAAAEELAARLAACSPWELESVLKLKPELALKAFGYYQDFAAESRPAPALLAFQGLAYRQIAAADFTAADWQFAQGHLRILSALYGLLRPLDGIKPYRLDFMGRLRIGAQNLYQYWGERVCRALYAETDTLINLASAEYAKLILPHRRPGERLIECRFLAPRRGKLASVATEAKIARGQMVRYLVENRLEAPERLRDFCFDGYTFAATYSSPAQYTFVKG